MKYPLPLVNHIISVCNEFIADPSEANRQRYQSALQEVLNYETATVSNSIIYFQSNRPALSELLNTLLQNQPSEILAPQAIPSTPYWPDYLHDLFTRADLILTDLASLQQAIMDINWARELDIPLLAFDSSGTFNPQEQGFLLPTANLVTDLQMLPNTLGQVLANPGAYILPTLNELAPTHIIQGDERELMLAKVEEYWIDNVLKPAVYNRTRFVINLFSTPNTILKHPVYADYEIGTSKDIGRIFEDVGHQLLILGRAGSGKTVLLLQLTERLLQQAKRDPYQPIPVVFKLASWSQESLDFAHWMEEELVLKYAVPPKKARRWIQEQTLVPLLDGLDEVEPNQREGCITAINAFKHQFPQTSLVVCSREAEYRSLTEKLAIPAAVLLAPLTLNQIIPYLDIAEFKGLREAIQLNSNLENMASNPFLFNLMLTAYENSTVAALLEVQENPEKHLIGQYLAKLNISLPLQNMLTWLADRMSSNKLNIFQVKTMQPSLLTSDEKQRYLQWVGGSIAFLGFILITLTRGIGIALEVGVLNAFIGSFIMGIWVASVSYWAFHHLKGVVMGALFAAVYGSSLGIARGISHSLTEGGSAGLSIALTDGLTQMFVYLLTFSLGFYANGAMADRDRIIIERRQFNIWRALAGGTLTLIMGILNLANQGLFHSPLLTPLELLLCLLAWGSFGFWAIGLTSPLISVEKLHKEQSIKQYGFYFLVISILLALSGAISFSLPEFLSGHYKATLINFLWGSNFFVAGLFFGGLPVLQNMVLHSILDRNHKFPLASQLLDQATELALLRKVGNGYIFAHKYLLDYFKD